MTANSFTGLVNTHEDFATIESLTVGVTGSSFTGFTTDKVYTLFVQNSAILKIADAEFPMFNQSAIWTATSDTPYIKTNNTGCVLTILEN